MFMRDDRILRFSVGCLKQNGALQHLEIKLMMDVYQTVLANTSTNYNVFLRIEITILRLYGVMKNIS